MKAIKIVGFISLSFLGVFIFIFGGYDDSPGAQLLGLLVFIGGVVGVTRQTRKK